jgi:cytochrome c5
MFLFVLGALVAFSIIIMFIAGSVTEGLDKKQAGDSRMQAEIAKRIAPVGEVQVAAADAAPAAPKSGEQVVTESCNACHGTGALGAPKMGDGAAWEARMGGGLDALVQSAITGKGAMPPRGGAAGLSDDEMRAAIVHMLNESGIEAGASSAAAEAAPVVEEAVQAVEQAAADVAEAAGGMVDSAMGAVVGMADAVMPQTAAPAVADLANGKAVYDAACFVCHTTGAAGAPRLGDKAAWAPRIAQGNDTLNRTALSGKGGMPPKGGRMDLSDQAVLDAVAYMVDQAK